MLGDPSSFPTALVSIRRGGGDGGVSAGGGGGGGGGAATKTRGAGLTFGLPASGSILGPGSPFGVPPSTFSPSSPSPAPPAPGSPGSSGSTSPPSAPASSKSSRSPAFPSAGSSSSKPSGPDVPASVSVRPVSSTAAPVSSPSSKSPIEASASSSSPLTSSPPEISIWAPATSWSRTTPDIDVPSAATSVGVSSPEKKPLTTIRKPSAPVNTRSLPACSKLTFARSIPSGKTKARPSPVSVTANSIKPLPLGGKSAILVSRHRRELEIA